MLRYYPIIRRQTMGKITKMSEHEVSTKNVNAELTENGPAVRTVTRGAVSFISAMKSLFTSRRFAKTQIRNAQ
jgi:hypothetical protein